MKALDVLNNVLQEQGLTWNDREKTIIAEIMQDSVELAAEEVAGAVDLAREWQSIQTQVAQVAAIAELRVTSVLPVALRRFAALALDVVFARFGLPTA